MERPRGYKRCDKVGEGIGYYVNYYAHTAVRSDGTPDPNPAKWQLLSTKKGGCESPVWKSSFPPFGSSGSALPNLSWPPDWF